MRSTMTRIEAAAAIATGAMDLTYSHGLAEGRRTIVISPVSHDVRIEDYEGLTAHMDPDLTEGFERVLTEAARDGDDAHYARVRQRMLCVMWTTRRHVTATLALEAGLAAVAGRMPEGAAS